MIIKKKSSAIAGFYELTTHIAHDDRGAFIKTYHQEAFESLGLNTIWPEEYYSVSRQGVLRGMHFQMPPFDHAKVVFCTEGQILDVALDLRRDSATYGQSTSIVLNSDEANMAYLVPGLAHGFYTLSKSATVFYKVATIYNPEADLGVRWNSFGFDWPNDSPILSRRDQELALFIDFKTPFTT